DSLTKGFVIQAKGRLEDALRNVNDDPKAYTANRNLLKAYLMLTDQDSGHPHLDVEWATGKFTRVWVDILKSSSGVNESDLRELVKPHVNYYFTLLKNGTIPAEKPEDQIVENARRYLQQVRVDERYYAYFVDCLSDEKYEEDGDNSNENLVFPPISLNDFNTDRPKVRKFITSKQFTKESKYKEVEGPYTEKGHAVVLMQIKGA